MTDDDFTLDPSEAARWDDIVTREWSSELAHSTTQARDEDASTDTTVLDAYTPPTLKIYLPRRPATLPLAISAMLTGVVVWVAITFLAPGYQRAVTSEVARDDRAEAMHQVTITGAVIAVVLLIAASSVSVWLVAFARYRLRRASCRRIALSTPATMRYFRPPNPVTAAIWVLLLLTVSAVAWWWISSRIDVASAPTSDAAASLHDTAVGVLTWLGIALLCAGGLALWASREGRHRLRRSAAAHTLRERRHSNPERTD
jgi:lysylphosphatidylglycerol synthetase-like protein (DUF2156 family)